MAAEFGGKVVVITGASSGIGAAVALRLGSRGAHLVLVGRNAENLQRTATQCKMAGSKGVWCPGARLKLLMRIEVYSWVR